MKRWRLCTAAALLVCAAPQVGYVQAPSRFAARIAQLSEPGGYFDTDNLISNERSYLQVMPALRKAGITGGAYVGVGPDLNFTYIAQHRCGRRSRSSSTCAGTISFCTFYSRHCFSCRRRG